MVQFRPKAREVIAKIVYYGPPLGGKTTNLRSLYDGYPEGTRGELVIVPAGTDRTIFFDFLPLEIGNLRGMKVRVQLYTVPGQVRYNATRQVVLRGVDGVVFVADSQRELLRSNQEAWENLKENLILQGTTLADVPHVLQYNKRDLNGIAGVEELDALLNHYNAPFFEAVASVGIGVEETVQGVIKLVVRSLRTRFQPDPRTGVQVPAGGADVDRVLSELRSPSDGGASEPAADPLGATQAFPALPLRPGPPDPLPGPPGAPAFSAAEDDPFGGTADVAAPPPAPEDAFATGPGAAAPPREGAFVFEPGGPGRAEPGEALPEAVEAAEEAGLLGVFAAAEDAPPAEGATGDDAFAFAVADSRERWWMGAVGEGSTGADETVPVAEEAVDREPGPAPVPGDELDELAAPGEEPREADGWERADEQRMTPAFEPDAGGNVDVAGQQEVWIAPEAGSNDDSGVPAFDVTEGAVTAPFRVDAVEHRPEPDPFDLGGDPFEVEETPSGDGSGDVFAIVAAPPPPAVVHEPAPEPLTVAVPVEIADVRRVASRALAQYGEVRELELEVPVPSMWVGGKRMTLQLRLTLVPQEEGHDG